MAELPAFKPSGAGGQVDLKNIIKSQAIAWGGFKSKLKRQYKDVAGTTFINGHEVYNKLNITEGIYNEDSEVYKFLELLGFTKENIADLAEQKSNSDYNINDMILQYNSNIDGSEESYEAIIDFIVDEMKNFDYITLDLRNISYEVGTQEPPPATAREFGLWYNTPYKISETEGNVDVDTGIEEKPEEEDWYFYDYESREDANWILPKTVPINTRPNAHRAMNNLTKRIYKDGVDVTARYSQEFVDFVALLAIAEPSMSLQANQTVYRSPINIGKRYCEVVGTDGYTDICANENPEIVWTELITSTTYQFNAIDRNVLYSRYEHSVTTCVEQGTCTKNATDEEKETKIPARTHAGLIWKVAIEQAQDDLLELTDGLFYRHSYDCRIRLLPNGTWGEVCYGSDIYLTVEGLKKAQPAEFGFYMSQFLEIHYVLEKQGFFARFIGGLINAFLSLVDAIVGVFLKIPVLKQITEIVLSVIGSLFGVDASGARDILGQIILVVVISLVAPYALEAVGLSSAASTTALLPGLEAGMSSLVTYSSHAMSFYNAGMQAKMVGESKKHAMEKANKDYALKKAEENMNKSQMGLIGTMGTFSQHQSKDMIMYDVMFNPFYYFNQAVIAEENPSMDKIY